MKIKVTLRGLGGELDSRTFDAGDPADDVEYAIADAVIEIAETCVLSVGDRITIEEIAQ